VDVALGIGVILGGIAALFGIYQGGRALWNHLRGKSESTSEYKELLDKYEKSLSERAEEKAEDKFKLKTALEEVVRLRTELGQVEKQELALIEAPGVEDKPQKRKALQASLASVADHFTIAYEAVEREDWPVALKHYEAALAERRTVAVLNNLAIVYRRMSRFKDALDLYDEAEKLCLKQGLPYLPDIAMNRGNVYQNLSRYEDALSAYDKAERLREEQGLPPDPGLATNRGVVYGELGRFEDELSAYDEAERLREEQGLPPDPGLATNRGVVYRNLSRYEDALEAYAEAERLRDEQGLPVDPTLTFNRAHVYFAQGDMETACRLAREARDMYAVHLPQAPVHPIILGFIEEQCGGDGESKQ